MSKSENRHYNQVWANKKHPASKCRKAKCAICHWGKVFGITKYSDKRKMA